jgi:prolipoprotein diacylglyceryltransferase
VQAFVKDACVAGLLGCNLADQRANNEQKKKHATNPLKHPAQLYEVALGILVMLCLFLVDRRLKEKRPRGLLISVFFVLYFAGRFVVEFFKEYQVLSPEHSPLTMGQYLSIPGFLLGAYGVQWSLRKQLPAGWPPDKDYAVDEADNSMPVAHGQASAQRRARR